MLPEDLGGLDERHFGRHSAVGPDLHGELVVVGLLADAGLLDLVLHAGHGTEHRVERNDPDLLRGLTVLAGRHIAAAVFHDHFQLERHVVGERRDHKILVDHLDRFVRLDVGACDRTLRRLLDPNDTRRVAVVLHDEALHRQHDVGDVLEHALDGRELMQRARKLDLRDGAALETRQQHPTKGIAHRGAKAAFERLGRELAVGSGERLGVGRDRARQLQAPPANVHTNHSFRYLEHNSMIRLACTGIDTSSAAGRRSTRPSGIALSPRDRKSGTSRRQSANAP